MDVLGGGSRPVFERLLMALEAAGGVRPGHPERRVVEPFAGALEVRAWNARVALADAHVRPPSVESVERGREQLVAQLERLRERLLPLVVHDQRLQLVLIGVHRHGIVHGIDRAQIRHYRPDTGASGKERHAQQHPEGAPGRMPPDKHVLHFTSSGRSRTGGRREAVAVGAHGGSTAATPGWSRAGRALRAAATEGSRFTPAAPCGRGLKCPDATLLVASVQRKTFGPRARCDRHHTTASAGDTFERAVDLVLEAAVADAEHQPARFVSPAQTGQE